MTIQLVNLTQESVSEQIEQILNQTFEHHQSDYDTLQAFAHPDFRNELMAYVLNRVTNYYATVEEGPDVVIDEQFVKDYAPQSSGRLPSVDQLNGLIHEGMEQLLQTHATWVHQHIPQPSDDEPSGIEPSHWFG